MPDDVTPLLPGTLEMMVLKVLSVEAEHGWGIGQRLSLMSRGALDVNQGSLYPALQRLLGKGWITSEWRQTESGRRARYYRLTRSGASRLAEERENWTRQVAAVNRVLEYALGL